jgi:hypothetical protein
LSLLFPTLSFKETTTAIVVIQTAVAKSAKVMLVLAQSLAHVLALPATEMYRPAGMDITHRAVVDATAAHSSSMEALSIWPVARIEARSN